MTASKNVDRGHYVAAPIPSGAVEVAAGQKLSLCMEPDHDMAFRLGPDSELELCLLIFPGRNFSGEVSIDFEGEGAKAFLSGFYICTDESSLSLNVKVRHRVGNCVSRQLFNGIVAGKAKTVFDGRIVVAPDARGTKAFQENNNLLLSGTADARTLPQLEIYNDEVECSHGATVGRLDENARFYMRSRGILDREAKVLQMISFLSPVLEHVPDNQHDDLASRLEETVRSLAVQ